ncbi:major histocompatibility complex class I-related gene protein-like [Acanthopagrus schlegelii]
MKLTSNQNMKILIFLALSSHFAFSVKHSLKFTITASSGLPDFPEYVGAAVVDENHVGSCDDSKLIIDPKHDWMKQIWENYPSHLEEYKRACFLGEPTYFKAEINRLKQRFNQSGGVHILQRMNGCEWDDETGEVVGCLNMTIRNMSALFYCVHILQRISGCEWDDETREVVGFNQYGYDGEDFISFDLNTETWIAPKQQAFTTKLRWDADKARMKFNHNYLTTIFPEWLKNYVHYGRSSLLRTVSSPELPSVSLLQKTPSSPVSCLATGFYPHRASLVWRKDGEELHEEVDHGEILPNHDGTFQMSVDLKLSSVTPEDWTRYDCVFQLSGVKEEIITRLEKDRIRTNWEEPSKHAFLIIVIMVLIAVVLTIGFIVYKKTRAKPPTSQPSTFSPGERGSEEEKEGMKEDGAGTSTEPHTAAVNRLNPETRLTNTPSCSQRRHEEQQIQPQEN